MAQTILLNLMIYLSVFLLSFLLVFTSKRGNLGINLQNFCKTQSLTELSLLLFIVSGIVILIFNLLSFIILNFFLDIKLNPLYMDNPATQNQDPVKWWPSGVPQTWGIIGTALAAYRTIPGSPRV